MVGLRRRRIAERERNVGGHEICKYIPSHGGGTHAADLKTRCATVEQTKGVALVGYNDEATAVSL